MIEKLQFEEDAFLTTSQAATFLNICTSTLKKFIRTGKILSIKTPGGHYRVRKKDINGAPRAYPCLHAEVLRFGTQAWYLLLPAYAKQLSRLASAGYPLTCFGGIRRSNPLSYYCRIHPRLKPWFSAKADKLYE